MGKIIRVTSCAECPYRDDMRSGIEYDTDDVCCDYDIGMGARYFNINKAIANNTVHENCPLEDDKEVE